nr:WYL domain-containing protein [Paenibacillus apiarius]
MISDSMKKRGIMVRADRLLSILLLLQNHGKMTSRELARRLEVSERTIFRDMEALCTAGIPVYADRGSTGGWALTEGYRTRLTGMKAQELMSLLLMNSSSLVDDLGLRGEFDSACLKLLAASPAELRRDAEVARERIHVDGAGWHQTSESSTYLPVVQEAVWEERTLRIEYERHDGLVTRTIHPLGLVAKRSVWYVVADTDGGLRSYRLSRVRHAELLEEAFARPAGFDLAAYWEQSTAQFQSSLPRYPARVRLNDRLLPRFTRERYVKVLHTVPADDGWSEADVEFDTLDSAAEMILGFGSFMEAIAPAELRSRVISEAKAILARYKEL